MADANLRIVLTVEFDTTKADAYNETLFSGPEFEDPVIGDGRSLILDVIKDSGIDEIVDRHSGLRETIVAVSATADGEPFDYPIQP